MIKTMFKMFLLYGLLLSSLTNAMPESNSIIENKAMAEYFSDIDNIIKKVESNIVLTTITAIPDFDLSPKDIVKNVTTSELILFNHTIVNTGNTEINPFVSVLNNNNDNFDIINLEIYIDENKNGIIDQYDSILLNNSSINLKFKEAKDIIIKGYSPTIINNPNEYAKIDLNVSLPSFNINRSSNDKAIYFSGPFIDIIAKSNKYEINKNEEVMVDFFAENIGDDEAKNTELYIDGVLYEYVYIEFEIPKDMKFVDVKYNNNFYVRYKGESIYSFNSFDPNQKEKIESVIFVYDSLNINNIINNGVLIKPKENTEDFFLAKFTINYKDSLIKKNKDSNIEKIVLLENNKGEIYFLNKEMDKRIKISDENSIVGLALESAYCNDDKNKIEEIFVNLKTRNLSDEENNIKLIETDINTGVFVFENLEIRKSESSLINNGYLEVNKNDIIYVEKECKNVLLKNKLHINPISVIFNAENNEPVSGIPVSLYKEDTLLKSVSNVAGDSSSYLNSFLVYDSITDENGEFIIPELISGVYFIDVNVEKTIYKFPSEKNIDELNKNRFVLKDASYGNKFIVENDNEILSFDIPIDNKENAGLFVSKKANDDIFELGDIVEYQIEVFNRTGLILEDLIFEDIMPRGISLYKNEFYINDKKYNFKKNKNIITANIKKLEIDEKLNIKYNAQITSDIYNGNRKNIAHIYNNKVNSNKAVKEIKISDSIINSEGVIFGKIYMDCNKNRIQEKEELGIPNVKIYLDTGHYVETDVEGKYNFKTLKARTYVLSVDKSTLPRNNNFHKTKSKNNNDPYSIFVDLKEGDFYKSNFTEGNCGIDYLKEVIERKNKILNLRNIHGIRFFDDSSKYQNILEQDNIVFEEYKNEEFNIKEDAFILDQADINFDDVINRENNDLDFLFIKENDNLAIKQQNIFVKGKVGSTFKLKVNGKEIPKERVGQKLISKSKGIQIWEYIAVKFDVGENSLEVNQVDPFGNIRDKKEIKVTAPGEPSSFIIEIPREKIEANGYSEMPINIKVVDKNGTKVNSKIPITIYSNFSKWKIYDEDENKSGIQTYIVNGVKKVIIIAPENFQEDVITVESGIMKTEAMISYKPNMKPLVVAGIISLQDGDEINRWEKDDENHISLFMQGKIKGDSLLTLNYDNKVEKELKGKISPDEFYEIYGDASNLSFEGETYRKLYIKIEQDGRYIMYGNFTPKFVENNNKIATYQRNMPGIEGYYSTKNIKIKPFVGVSGDKTIRKEVKSKGISGPYNILPQINEKLNWTIYLIEKDNSNNIISKKEQLLNQDYIVNENGFVYFNRPILNNENNVYIMVEYFELDGSEPYFTKGILSEYEVSDEEKIYNQIIIEEENDNNILGVSYEKKYEKSKIELEYSRTNNEKTGNASRIAYQYNGTENKVKFESSVTDENYKNDYSLSKNNSKYIKGESFHIINNSDYKVKNRLDYQEDNNINQKVKGVSTGIYKSINNNLNTELNFKKIVKEIEDENKNYNIINNVFSYNPNFLPKSQWDLSTDLDFSGKKSSEIRSEYFIKERSKIYFSHKLINEFDSSFDISSNSDTKTSFGVSYETPKEGNLYSEIRLRDTESVDELIYAFGANQGVKINENSKILVGYEKEENIDKKTLSENFYIGYEYKTNSTDIYKAKTEYSRTENDIIKSLSISAINRIDKNYSTFNKFNYENVKSNKFNYFNYETNYIYRPIDKDNLNWMLGYEYTKNADNTQNAENYIKSYINYDINTNFQYLGHIGYKNKINYSGIWITSRLMYDLNEKTDVGLRFGFLKDTESQYMVGLETGRQFLNNAWLSIGYNFKYIKNDNYGNSDNADQSLYCKLRIKLDDSLFFWIQ